MVVEDRGLADVLDERREAVIKEWLVRTLRTYPEATTRFLFQEADTFRNPVGYALKEGLRALFDGLVESRNASVMAPVLDNIVRIRAVQDFTASQAVAFVFLLKQVIREELKNSIEQYWNDLTPLEARIDEMALLAFDVFMQCRQQICEIRVNEAKRRVSLLERAFQAEPSDQTR